MRSVATILAIVFALVAILSISHPTLAKSVIKRTVSGAMQLLFEDDDTVAHRKIGHNGHWKLYRPRAPMPLSEGDAWPNFGHAKPRRGTMNLFNPGVPIIGGMYLFSDEELNERKCRKGFVRVTNPTTGKVRCVHRFIHGENMLNRL